MLSWSVGEKQSCQDESQQTQNILWRFYLVVQMFTLTNFIKSLLECIKYVIFSQSNRRPSNHLLVLWHFGLASRLSINWPVAASFNPRLLFLMMLMLLFCYSHAVTRSRCCFWLCCYSCNVAVAPTFLLLLLLLLSPAFATLFLLLLPSSMQLLFIYTGTPFIFCKPVIFPQINQ